MAGRRLAGDWRGAATALATARGHLPRGTGSPIREARLLSIQASLAMDTGRLEQALELLGRSLPGTGVFRLPAWATGTAVPEAAGGAPELPAILPQAPGRRLLVAEPPDPAASLAELGYKGALEQYSRQIVAAGLAQSQGRIGEASRLLGLSPKAVQAKLKGFLTSQEE